MLILCTVLLKTNISQKSLNSRDLHNRKLLTFELSPDVLLASLRLDPKYT